VANCCRKVFLRLGLARAKASSGDTAGARVAYQDFLGIWKDAAEDNPILKAAKAEYAKLQKFFVKLGTISSLVPDKPNHLSSSANFPTKASIR